MIKLLEAHERKYRFSLNDGQTIIQRREWPKDVYGETPAGVSAWRGTSFQGKDMLVPFHATDNLHNGIIDYIDEKGPFDCILEVGCGYGRGLFEMSRMKDIASKKW